VGHLPPNLSLKKCYSNSLTNLFRPTKFRANLFWPRKFRTNIFRTILRPGGLPKIFDDFWYMMWINEVKKLQKTTFQKSVPIGSYCLLKIEVYV
jgi:hypothetical protein